MLIWVFFAGCSKSDDNAVKSTGVSNNLEFDACALLAKSDPSSILGEEAREPNRTTDDLLQSYNTKNFRNSHCAISGKKSGLYKSIFLTVIYAGNKENPKTAKDAFNDKQKKENEELEIETEEVPGLGDVAVKGTGTESFHLWVFWKKHYQMNVMLNGMENQEIALEKAKAVAQLIMSEL